MEFLIITGLSGAGKSRAADVLEDLEYYCVDNMPVALIPRFAELCLDAHGRYEKVALVTDVRERESFGELLSTLEELKAMDCTVRILYMDADLRTLVRRYKESRRPHPLAGKGVTLEQAVAKEEELLAPIKAKADFVLNSSRLTLGQLQSRGGPAPPLRAGQAGVGLRVRLSPDRPVHGHAHQASGLSHPPLCGGGQGEPGGGHRLHRRAPPQRGHRRRPAGSPGGQGRQLRERP